MSRHRYRLTDGRFVIAGYDPPLQTWYAQLYESYDDPNDAPHKVVGYSPTEVSLTLDERPDAHIGPYPIPARDALIAYMRREWRIDLRHWNELQA